MKNTLVLLCVLVLFSQCKKSKNEESEKSIYVYTPPPNNPLPASLIVSVPSDADGVLMASRTPYKLPTSYTTKVGNASAFFYTSPTNFALLDAGTVKCNDSLLAKINGGSYNYNGVAVNGQPESGIVYSGSGSTWTVSGNGSVPSFSVAHPVFPTDAVLTSSSTFTKTNAYTVTYSGATNADSVVIVFGGDSTTIKKVVVASAGSYSYTASEVHSVRKKASSTGYFHFVPYKTISTTVASKKYYMVNATTAVYTVNIQ